MFDITCLANVYGTNENGHDNDNDNTNKDSDAPLQYFGQSILLKLETTKNSKKHTV